MRAIALMTKYPRIGEVKSRLKLSPFLSLKLYQAFLRDLESLLIKSKPYIYADLFCFFSIEEDEIPQDFKFCEEIEIKKQRGKGLGEKISNVLEDLEAQGYQEVIIIGGDTLNLRLEDFEISFLTLESEPSAVILGPTLDGGIYLLAHNTNNETQYFKKIDWGTDKVFSQLETNINQTGQLLIQLKEKRDIDTREDLLESAKEIHNARIIAPHTKNALEECFLNNCCILG